MERKHLGIIASALALVVLTLWLTQGDDAGAQSASSQNAIPAAGSSSASANPSALPGKSGNGYASTQQNERYATQLVQADQARSSATSPARNNTSSSSAKNSTTPFASPVQTRSRIKPAPLEPRAEPYALMANSGSATVRFSVRVTGDADPSTTVYLRQSGAEGAIALNDQGVDGDIVARDNIHGGNIVLDTSRLQPDTCLSYIATLKDGESETVSSPLNLCISSFPVRVATPNTNQPIMLDDGVKAIANELILYAKPATRASVIQRIADELHASVVGSIPPLGLYQLRLASSVSAPELQAMVMVLNSNGELLGASVNALASPAGHIDVTTDPEFASQHGVQLVTKHPTLAGNYVWDAGAIGTGVTVIVADEGLDRTHPEFGSLGDCQVTGNDCGAMAVNDDNAVAGILQWHGTRVSGIIAAKGYNTQGIAGVAHGSKILPYKVTSYALTNLNQVFVDVGGLVASNGATVVNASFSGGPWSGVGYAAAVTALCSAVNGAITSGGGAIAVIAAGNNNADNWYYPARCNEHASVPAANRARIIVVGNSTSVNTTNCGSVGVEQRCAAAVPADPNLLGSNYGAWVDVMAPGSDIRTTTSGSYATSTGTSFSTPIVSGAVAILNSCGTSLDSIKSTLISSATVNVPYPNAGAPTGSTPRLDIYRALAQVNHTPTAVGLTNSSLNENTDTTAGVDVGVLVTTDADTCDKYSYSITGGADAASFSIDTATGTLRLAAGVLNFEAKASYAVTVRVTDYFGAFFDQALTVSVNNVNEPPVIGSQTFSVNEGSANGTAVGTVSASDPDAGDTKTFSITAGNTGSAFAISPTTGVITVSNSAALVFATNPTFSLTVKVTDSGGLFASATVTVNVNSVAATNHAPSISAQTFSVSESSSNGTAVGTVLASDPDAGDSLSYSITAGNTGGAFALNASTGALTVGNSTALSYATTPSYALTVQVTDTGSLSASATMAVNVSAASAPAPTPTPPPAAPPASGGGGGCSVMPAGAEPDSSLLLAMMVVLGYGVRRRKS